MRNGFLQIELPLPPKGCSVNSHVHWGIRARATRLYREQCAILIKQATNRKRAMSGPVTIDLDFYTYKDRKILVDDGFYRPRDLDNCLSSAKAAIDSLRDAGVVKNDSKRYVQIGQVRLHSRQKEHCFRTCMVMTLRPGEKE